MNKGIYKWQAVLFKYCLPHSDGFPYSVITVKYFILFLPFLIGTQLTDSEAIAQKIRNGGMLCVRLWYTQWLGQLS